MPRPLRRRSQDAMEESERTKAAEVEAAVQSAIQGYRSSEEFAALLDREVGSEMADMLYRFKRYNPGQKLNLNFAADPTPASRRNDRGNDRGIRRGGRCRGPRVCRGRCRRRSRCLRACFFTFIICKVLYFSC